MRQTKNFEQAVSDQYIFLYQTKSNKVNRMCLKSSLNPYSFDGIRQMCPYPRDNTSMHSLLYTPRFPVQLSHTPVLPSLGLVKPSFLDVAIKYKSS